MKPQPSNQNEKTTREKYKHTKRNSFNKMQRIRSIIFGFDSKGAKKSHLERPYKPRAVAQFTAIHSHQHIHQYNLLASRPDSLPDSLSDSRLANHADSHLLSLFLDIPASYPPSHVTTISRGSPTRKQPTT
jgi:hypothetical protein